MDKFVKTNQELKIMQKAADLAVECMKYISHYLIRYITERDLAKKIDNWFYHNGADGLAFDTIVAFGDNASDPHHKPTDRQLTQNDVIVIDMGCVYQGYCSDITRTFLPLCPTKKQIEVYNIVLLANKTGIAKAKPGMKASELDKICRDVIEEKGYGKYFIHTTGHGIGKEVHEGLRIGKNDHTVLKNNMAFTIEPGIYIPNEFGIRIEDTVVLNNGKINVLTKEMAK